MKTVFRVTIVSFVVGLVAMSAFPKDALANNTPQAMHVSCTAPNPEYQTGLHRPKGDGSHWVFSIVLDGGARFVKGPVWTYPGSDGTDPDWGLVTGGADGDSSMDWLSPGKTGEFKVRVSGQIVCGNGGGGGAPIDFSVGWDGDVCPGVQKVQYDDPSNGYVDITETLYVLKGTKVTFKAIPDEPDAEFCDGEPEWGGSAGASGTGETKDVTFNTLSTSKTDYKTVTVTGGQTSTVNVVVYDLTLDTKAQDAFTGRSETRYGVGEWVNLTYITQPAGIDVDLVWKIVDGNGTINGDVWIAGETTGLTELSAEINSGISAGESRNISRQVVTPTGVIMRHRPNAPIFHIYNTASTGFKGDPYLQPSDVSFSGVKVKEFAAQGRGTGYFACGPTPENPNLPACANHKEGTQWQFVYSPGLNVQTGFGSPVNGPDSIRTAVNWRTPYSGGTFQYDIPWKYTLNGGVTAYLIEYVASIEVIESNGKITKSKGGDSQSSNLLDPTSDVGWGP